MNTWQDSCLSAFICVHRRQILFALRRQLAGQRGKGSLHEIYRGPGGGVGIAIANRHHDLDQRGVAAVIAYGVGDQPELGGEFTGDDAVMALIPVQRHALLVAAGGKVAVDPDGFGPAWNRDQNRPGLDWLKTVSRQAILRRVGSLPVALRLEERDK